MRAKRFICIMRLAMLMVEESHKMITLGEFFRAFCTLLVLLKEGINGARPNVKSWGILMHNRPGGWVWKCALSALNVGKVGFPPPKKKIEGLSPLAALVLQTFRPKVPFVLSGQVYWGTPFCPRLYKLWGGNYLSALSPAMPFIHLGQGEQILS